MKDWRFQDLSLGSMRLLFLSAGSDLRMSNASPSS
eukprot:CAMPEP_0177730724 /NCGR_PEP_ID=MMETSP0484_2-20121128/22149_1 /TAXON_ID=354590 /ORGANISM="Rhodomonas lens, Strain RHODO" /LENGTH=34 /DNA_ID= /DNA_START= /DNA_END= /DNA_ORIENTATION=